MSDLTDAFTTAITGRPAVNEESSLQEIMGDLFFAAGMKGATAARAIGISPTTFYRNRNYAFDLPTGIKQKPKVSNRAMVAAARALSLSPAKKAAILRKELKLGIVGVMGKSSYYRRRDPANVGAYFPEPKIAQIMGPILDAWLAVDDDLLDELIREAVSEHYEGLEIQTVEAIKFLT